MTDSAIPSGQRRPPSRNGQGLAEFALIVPLLLLVVLGVIEFGRLMAIYSMVSSSARNATRYGTAVGNNGSGTPYYLDCPGIRDAAKRGAAALLNLEDGAITVQYDDGQTVYNNCDSSPAAGDIGTGHRLRVTVTGTYTPLVPIVKIPPLPFSFVSTRTIIKTISGPPECNDSLDNDGDGQVDFGADPDCQSIKDNTEGAPPTPSVACSNGQDDDGDGFVDFAGGDPGCSSASDTEEYGLSVTFEPGYPMYKSSGNPKPIAVKVRVQDDAGDPVDDATVSITYPFTAGLTSLGGGGLYGAGGTCYVSGTVTPKPATVTVEASKLGATATTSSQPMDWVVPCP